MPLRMTDESARLRIQELFNAVLPQIGEMATPNLRWFEISGPDGEPQTAMMVSEYPYRIVESIESLCFWYRVEVFQPRSGMTPTRLETFLGLEAAALELLRRIAADRVEDLGNGLIDAWAAEPAAA